MTAVVIEVVFLLPLYLMVSGEFRKTSHLRVSRSRDGSKGGEGRNRTGDTTVFSRVLYQLSYLAAGRSV